MQTETAPAGRRQKRRGSTTPVETLPAASITTAPPDSTRASKVRTLNFLKGAFPSETPPARFWLTLLFRAGGVNFIYNHFAQKVA